MTHDDGNQVMLVAAGAHVRIIRAMDQCQDNAQVQITACGALWNLALNDANKGTLVAAGAHVRIIRAMDRHQDNNAGGPFSEDPSGEAGAVGCWSRAHWGSTLRT